MGLLDFIKKGTGQDSSDNSNQQQSASAPDPQQPDPSAMQAAMPYYNPPQNTMDPNSGVPAPTNTALPGTDPNNQVSQPAINTNDFGANLQTDSSTTNPVNSTSNDTDGLTQVGGISSNPYFSSASGTADTSTVVDDTQTSQIADPQTTTTTSDESTNFSTTPASVNPSDPAVIPQFKTSVDPTQTTDPNSMMNEYESQDTGNGNGTAQAQTADLNSDLTAPRTTSTSTNTTTSDLQSTQSNVTPTEQDQKNDTLFGAGNLSDIYNTNFPNPTQLQPSASLQTDTSNFNSSESTAGLDTKNQSFSAGNEGADVSEGSSTSASDPAVQITENQTVSANPAADFDNTQQNSVNASLGNTAATTSDNTDANSVTPSSTAALDSSQSTTGLTDETNTNTGTTQTNDQMQTGFNTDFLNSVNFSTGSIGSVAATSGAPMDDTTSLLGDNSASSSVNSNIDTSVSDVSNTNANLSASGTQPHDSNNPNEQKKTKKSVKNVYKKIALLGLGNGMIDKTMTDAVTKVAKELLSKNIEVLVDTKKGYGKSIIESTKNSKGKVTGIFLKPFYARGYKEDSDLNTGSSAIIYSNFLERLRHIAKEARMFVMFDASGLYDFAVLTTLWSIAKMYKGKNKPIVLVGEAWNTKLTNLKTVFGLTDEDTALISVINSIEDLPAEISRQNEEFGKRATEKVQRVVDRRVEGDEMDFMVY